MPLRAGNRKGYFKAKHNLLHLLFWTGQNKGYAFVRYKSALSAKRAADELATGSEVKGKAISVIPADDNDTLFLGNIERTWTKEQVRGLQGLGSLRI